MVKATGLVNVPFLRVALLVSAASLAGCPSTECTELSCVPIDASTFDASSDAPRVDASTDAPGLDAFSPPDGGVDAFAIDANCACTDGLVCVPGGGCGCLDDTQCSGATPACNTTTHQCAPCSPTNVSVCTTTQPACDVSDAMCTCTSTSCTSATAARCNEATNACDACTADADCADVAGNPRCVSGVCRACTVATEAADCGTTSCNPTTLLCGTRARESINACNACDADSECVPGFTCADVNPLLGNSGTYCLPIRVAVTDECPRQYFSVIDGATNDRGVTINYCRPRTTTCQASLHYRTQQSVVDGGTTYSCGNVVLGTANEACGVVGVNDGLCRLTGGSNRCTYFCTSDDDCPDFVGFTCLAGPSPRYCSL